MPYGPHTGEDRARMLEALGLTSVEPLFADIPPAVRAHGLDLPGPLPELELAQRLETLAARNRTDLASFLGAGVYRHYLPPVVDQMLLRGEFYTAYTPYQPEISQGTLQTIYEYQSMLVELTGLDVVSASHYDGAAATAEAALMTVRATHRTRVLVSRAVHRHYVETTRTYFRGAELTLDELPTRDDGTTDLAALERELADQSRPVAGVLMGQPNAFGLSSRWPTRPASPTPRAPSWWRSSSRCRSPSLPHPARTVPISRPARASRSASRRSTAVPTWASWPARSPWCGRSPAGLSARRPTRTAGEPSS